MFSDQSWITLVSLLVTFTSLVVTCYIYRKSEPSRHLARVQFNKELSRSMLTKIADVLRTWEKEMQDAEKKQ